MVTVPPLVCRRSNLRSENSCSPSLTEVGTRLLGYIFDVTVPSHHTAGSHFAQCASFLGVTERGPRLCTIRLQKRAAEYVGNRRRLCSDAKKRNVRYLRIRIDNLYGPVGGRRTPRRAR